MNLTRLMVLGTLARYGPTHGHQIRRIAEVTNVGHWGGVSVGALYRELRALDAEGLVESIRTEQVGRRPARTVYAITEEGKFELHVLRSQAFQDPWPSSDPLGVALTFAWYGADREEVATDMRARRERWAISAEHVAAEAERLVARGYINAVEAAVMRRGVMHAETEVRWHDEFAKLLAELPPDDAPPAEDQAAQQGGDD